MTFGLYTLIICTAYCIVNTINRNEEKEIFNLRIILQLIAIMMMIHSQDIIRFSNGAVRESFV